MPIKWVSTAMFSLVRIPPMFEQEAPKWFWKLFNDADSNTIHVGSQRGWPMIQIWPKVTSQWARHFANQMGIDSYVLFGSNTTHVWTGSPQVTLLLTARFEYDHKPDPPSSYHVILQWKQHVHLWRRKKDRGPALLLIIIYTWLREVCTPREPVAQV